MSHETNRYTAEEMTAYLDGDVSPEVHDEMAAYFASHDEARAELRELRATVELLRGLPKYRPRRSFTLGAEHSSEPQSSEGPTSDASGAETPSNVIKFLPLARWGTLAAVVLFVTLAGFGYLTDQYTVQEPDEAAAPEPAAEFSIADMDREEGTELDDVELEEVTEEEEAFERVADEAADPEDAESRGEMEAVSEDQEAEEALPTDDPPSPTEPSAPEEDEATGMTPFLIGLIAVGGVAAFAAVSWLAMRLILARG